MPKLDQETLLAIGRMTVAAADLEHTLAWVASGAGALVGRGDPVGLDDPVGLGGAAGSGDLLAAARAWARSAPPSVRDEYAGLVEGAATQLARGRAALHSLWGDGDPATAATFDEITMFLTRVRDAVTETWSSRRR